LAAVLKPVIRAYDREKPRDRSLLTRRLQGVLDVSLLPTRLLAMTTMALLLALGAAVPVQADTSLGETGTTGFHALRDSESRPSYSCHYKGMYPPSDQDHYEGKLNRIDVRPPKMKAISGQQEVGWRFSVERRGGSDSNWRVTYRSSIQRDTTSPSRNASFSIRDVKVGLPADGAFEDTVYEYRVKVRMFWYRENGGVQGTSMHVADWYSMVNHNLPGGGTETFSEEAPCRGWVSTTVN